MFLMVKNNKPKKGYKKGTLRQVYNGIRKNLLNHKVRRHIKGLNQSGWGPLI